MALQIVTARLGRVLHGHKLLTSHFIRSRASDAASKRFESLVHDIENAMPILVHASRHTLEIPVIAVDASGGMTILRIEIREAANGPGFVVVRRKSKIVDLVRAVFGTAACVDGPLPEALRAYVSAIVDKKILVFFHPDTIATGLPLHMLAMYDGVPTALPIVLADVFGIGKSTVAFCGTKREFLLPDIRFPTPPPLAKRPRDDGAEAPEAPEAPRDTPAGGDVDDADDDEATLARRRRETALKGFLSIISAMAVEIETLKVKLARRE